MKIDYDIRPYRPCVGIVLINKNNMYNYNNEYFRTRFNFNDE